MSDEIEIEPLKVFVGWDSREDIAYQVCKQSILDHASVPVDIIPIKQFELRKAGAYTREIDALASTEFTFTRFLVPHLANWKGWALFIDCDFIFLNDIKKLFDQANNKYAVMCAQHDYNPKPGMKMDGQQQHIYPRKNWSSAVLFNCEHALNKSHLQLEHVNDPKKDGKYFHRFSWLSDNKIGKLSHEWNWLVGWYKEPEDGKPSALHYTEGGPWFEQYKDCEYAKEWYQAKSNYFDTAMQEKDAAFDVLTDKRQRDKERFERDRLDTTAEYLVLPDQKKKLVVDLINNFKDPEQRYYKSENWKEQIMAMREPRVAAINPGGIEDGGTDAKRKKLLFDEYLEAFILGCPAGRLSEWSDEQKTKIPLIIRGLGKQSQLAIKHSWENKRDFFYIDSGYMGNETSKSKIYHRVVKNNLQNIGTIIPRPYDRLERLQYRYKPFTKGSKILIVPPSDKVMKFWGQGTAQQWTDKLLIKLKKYTDRPVEVRLKPNRNKRIAEENIVHAFRNDVHCVITYNSIAATEALLNGKPAIALGPNAASVLCNSELKDIEEGLKVYNEDQMLAYAAHLSYCQFTRREMQDGTAWRILNESS